MPIIIKDYNWKQTLSNITIQIALKRVSERNADIFTSTRYIKVKYEQYFFEVLLLHSIDIDSSECKITDTHIIFDLKKEENQFWESLEPNISKKEKFDLKKQLLEDEYLRLQELAKEKVNRKAELKRVAVREQIELDSKEREHIEAIKKQEKTLALGDVTEWSKTVTAKRNTHKRLDKSNSNQISKKPIVDSPKKEKVVVEVPMPRSVATLEIDFTPREFPTPCRESKLEEENEWLRKQAEARRSVGFVSEDIRPEERNPQFLKAKGDEFLKNKNYLGAISAYSFGIKIAPKFVDLYIARSEAHLSAGNFHRAIQDCSTALDLLKPEVPLNLKERALCVGRRGEALHKVGMTRQGLEEIKISLKLMPSDYFTHFLETVNNVS